MAGFHRLRPWLAPHRWLRSPGAWFLCVVVVSVVILDHHYGNNVLRALWMGSFGSWYAFTSGTLVRAVPLILTGLGVAIAFRSGVFNIGAEGQLLAGAAAATFVGLRWSAPLGAVTLPVILLTGTVGGALWAGIAAFMRTRFGVLEVISTLMLNFVAADGVSYLVRGPLQEPLHIYPQSATLPLVARLPHFGPATRLHWGLVLAVLLVAVAAWGVSQTAVGFRLRAVGANPAAARVTGRISVPRATTEAFLVSGALAGLAGAIEVTAVTHALYDNLSPGYGFTAIAVAVLAGLRPLAVLPSALLFAGLETGATALQRDAGIPAAWASVLEACLILVAVAAVALRQRKSAAVSIMDA